MPTILNVYSTPGAVSREELAGRTVVVIDVLRATTTIVYALAAGASEVIACAEVDEARRRAEELAPGCAVLGGERRGLPIAGFDLGNSPDEYRPESVGGRSVVFTTSNGTRAMAHCRLAERVLLAAFVNVSSVFHRLLEEDEVHLLCAGSGGSPCRDDVLLAGMLAERLERQGGGNRQMNAQAVVARENWTTSFALPYVLGAEPLEPGVLAAELRRSEGGRHLTGLGLEADILAAAQIDQFSIVPEFDPTTFRIRADDET